MTRRSQILAFGSALLLMIATQAHAVSPEPRAAGSAQVAGTSTWQPANAWAVNGWIGTQLQFWTGFTAYQARTRPGSLVAYWLTERFNRLLGFFSTDGHGPIPGIADFGVLSVSPVSGVESSGYGYRRHPITRRRKFHKGVDFKAPRGTPVYAAGPGVVTHARRKSSYGRLIIISHGLGLETRYAHLNRIKVKEDQFVPAGVLIGTVGSSGRTTGPHLHFEVRQFDEPVDPTWALGEIRPSIADELAAVFSWLKK